MNESKILIFDDLVDERVYKDVDSRKSIAISHFTNSYVFRSDKQLRILVQNIYSQIYNSLPKHIKHFYSKRYHFLMFETT